jgi:hypothetical protein
MALSQAAALLEKAIGHGDNATTEQDITNPGRDRAKYADPSGEKMKALCWMGKNNAQVCKFDLNSTQCNDTFLTGKWSGCPKTKSGGGSRCYFEGHGKHYLWQ